MMGFMSTSLTVIQEEQMRQCGPCTSCCEGWLSADIKGHEMHPGKPCFFLADSKCTDYEGRPNTCKSYNCSWKREPDVFPEWLRPDLSGVIITKMVMPSRKDMVHYEVAEARGKLDVKTLNWLVQWALETGSNLFYEIEGKHHAIGSPAFKTWILGR